jgi:hypothetical protein
MKRLLLFGFLSHFLLFGGSFADMFTTREALRLGAREVNPFLPPNLKGQIAATAGLIAATEVGSTVLKHYRHPGPATVLRFEMGGLKTGVSIWNLHVIREQRQINAQNTATCKAFGIVC